MKDDEILNKEFHTIKTVSDRIGISYVCLNRAVNTGKVKAVRFGGQRLIRTAEFKKIMAEGF